MKKALFNLIQAIKFAMLLLLALPCMATYLLADSGLRQWRSLIS